MNEMDGLKRWESEWLRERIPLRWKELMSRLIFPGEPVSDDPDHINVEAAILAEIEFSFKFESRKVKLTLVTKSDRIGSLEPEDKSWTLDLGDVRKVDPEALADLLIDSYDVVVVMGS